MSDEVRVTDPVTGGQKGSKLARFDLIPPDVLWALAEHYGKNCDEHGGKYPASNWAKGYKYGLSYAAAQRHLNEFWMGVDKDPENGSLHVIAAAWHCFCLAAYMMRGKGTDDRLKEPTPEPELVPQEFDAGKPIVTTEMITALLNDVKGGQRCQK